MRCRSAPCSAVAEPSADLAARHRRRRVPGGRVRGVGVTAVRPGARRGGRRPARRRRVGAAPRRSRRRPVRLRARAALPRRRAPDRARGSGARPRRPLPVGRRHARARPGGDVPRDGRGARVRDRDAASRTACRPTRWVARPCWWAATRRSRTAPSLPLRVLEVGASAGPEPAVGPLRLRHRARGVRRSRQPGALRGRVGGRPARPPGPLRGGRAPRLRPQPARRHHPRGPPHPDVVRVARPDRSASPASRRPSRWRRRVPGHASTEPMPTCGSPIASRSPLPGRRHRGGALDRAPVPAQGRAGAARGRDPRRRRAGVGRLAARVAADGAGGRAGRAAAHHLAPGRGARARHRRATTAARSGGATPAEDADRLTSRWRLRQGPRVGGAGEHPVGRADDHVGVAEVRATRRPLDAVAPGGQPVLPRRRRVPLDRGRRVVVRPTRRSRRRRAPTAASGRPCPGDWPAWSSRARSCSTTWGCVSPPIVPTTACSAPSRVTSAGASVCGGRRPGASSAG